MLKLALPKWNLESAAWLLRVLFVSKEDRPMFARLAGALVVAMALSVVSVHAQATKKGPNGGILIVTPQGHPVEFVHSGLEITFYVDDDDGTPFPAKNLTRGRATVQDGGKTTTVSLSAAEPNKMVGKLQAPVTAKARIVVSIDIVDEGHKHTLQGRFTGY